MTLDVDPDEYPVPADGKVDDEIEEYIKETLYVIEGVTIKNMKLVSEET